MRLKILCEDRCEDIAVNLAAACVRSLRRSDQLRSFSESHHVHYMIDVYIVLLYKLKRTQDIFAQVSIDRILHNRGLLSVRSRSLSRGQLFAECANGFVVFVISFFKSLRISFDSIRRTDISDILETSNYILSYFTATIYSPLTFQGF